MALVLMETQPWGYAQRQVGNTAVLLPFEPVHIANTNGTPATTYGDQNYGSPTTADLTTLANGGIPGYIEDGEYDLTIRGITWRVEALAPDKTSARLANPTGANDSAAILAGFAALGTTGRLTLGPGVWRAALGTIGSTTAGAGVNYSIRGAGPYKTILAPVDATAGILKVTAPGDSSSDFFELDDIGICLPFDMDYAKPLIEIALQKGQLRIGENVRFYSGSPSTPNNTSSFMGTFLRLDGAYEGKVLAKFRSRKHAVPYEVVNLTNLTGAGVPPNWDTIEFAGTIDGVHGPIFRNAYSKAHGLTFNRFKVTASVDYPAPPFGEAGIATGGATAGASSVKVNTAMVAGTMPIVGDAIGVGFGDLYEVAKVSSVTNNGDGTTSLGTASPLRYSHIAADPVTTGGKACSFGDNYYAIKFANWHFESLMIGISAGNVRGITLDGTGQTDCSDLVRLEANTRAVTILPGVLSFGSPNRHTLVRKAPYNALGGGLFGEHVVYPTVDPNPLPGYFIVPTALGNSSNTFHEVRRNRGTVDSTTGSMTYIAQSTGGSSDRQNDAFQANAAGVIKGAIQHGGRGLLQGLVFADVGDTSAKTAAQIDTLANTLLSGAGAPSVSPLTDGLTVYDKTNKRFLTRVGTSWYPLAQGAAIV